MRLFLLSLLTIPAALALLPATAAHAAADNSGFGAPFAAGTVAALGDTQTAAAEDDMLAAAAALATIAPAAGDGENDDILPGEEKAGATDYAPLPDSLADKYIGP